jgi:uncharacterized protein YbjT (DUF2867 family)
VEAVRFDFRDPATYEDALAGVDRLFLLRPRGLTSVRRAVRPVLRAARQAGVEHVVFLSRLGAERNPLLPYRRIERLVERAGIPFTVLRPSFFMQQLSTTQREEIRERGEIFVPAGRGRTSFIDARDVAAVAAAVLGAGDHADRAYPLTGPQALDYYQVARILTEELGRPVFYRAPSALRFMARALRRGTPLPLVVALAARYSTTRLGQMETVTGDAAGILGRPPGTVRRFVRDHLPAWR